MLVIYATPAVHPKGGLLLVKRERDGDVQVIVESATILVRQYNARTADLHLNPGTFVDGVDAKEIVAPVQLQDGVEVGEKGRRRSGCGRPSNRVNKGILSGRDRGEHDVRGRVDSKLHFKHRATGGHPGCWKDRITKADDLVDVPIIHKMRRAVYLHDGLVGANCVVAVLEVKAELVVGIMFEEHVSNRAVDDVGDG